MPNFKDGQYIKELQWKRLIGSTPSSYTVFKYGTKYYAECNIPEGTDYSGSTASTIIQNAIDAT
jgi:hypothetical protein